MANTGTGDGAPPWQAPTRGAALGLPDAGPGSLASFSRRTGQYLIDGSASALVTLLFTGGQPPRLWSLATFVVMTVFFLAVAGQTPGMRVLGLRLAHSHPEQRLAPWRAVVRTLLLALLIPALVVDADGRGLHDRLTDTAVVLA